jgi:hypothetical protein
MQFEKGNMLLVNVPFTRAAMVSSRKGRLEPCPLSGSAAKFLTAGIETGSWRIDVFVVVPEGFSAFRRSVDASNDLQLSYRTNHPEKPLDRMFRR